MAESQSDVKKAASSQEASLHPFRVPPLHGRFVFLRVVNVEDYGFLRAAELSGELAVRWRFRGSTVSPERWAQSASQTILAQYVVVRIADSQPLGLVAAYQANFQDGHAFLGAETFARRQPSPLMILGTALFIDYVFTCWNFHKLYVEVAEYNLRQFQSGTGRIFEVEGQLREHLWYDGRRWDQFVLAIYRDAWSNQAGRLLAAAQRPREMRAHVRLPIADS